MEDGFNLLTYKLTNAVLGWTVITILLLSTIKYVLSRGTV